MQRTVVFRLIQRRSALCLALGSAKMPTINVQSAVDPATHAA
ncbi:hypothetical protein EPYR_00689 [Erwinia pyrifoliae DSM 12163]|nr:hypothetical protein EPYR_00689 [Erwinia pyrifoliae DSM 12163]